MVSAIFTGVVPIVYKAQRALLASLVPEYRLVVPDDHAAVDVRLPQHRRRASWR